MREWSPSDREVAIDELRHSLTVNEAVGKIRRRLCDEGITADSLRNVFVRRGLGNPRDYLAGALRDHDTEPVPERRDAVPPPKMARRLGDYGPSRVIEEPVSVSKGQGPERDASRLDGHGVRVVAERDLVEERHERLREQRDRDERRHLIEQLDEARSRQAFLDDISSGHEPPRIMPRERTGVREVTPVVLASDWHVEEEVDPVSVAGRNRYNLAIAERRIERFWQGAMWLVEHHRADGHLKIRDMVLGLLGDLMTGYIHPENIETSLLSPVETVRWLLPRLRNGIMSLVDQLQLERLVVVCSHGNHGRTTDKIRVSTGAKNSFEWLLYCTLADMFRDDPRVVFEVTQSEHQYVQVYDLWIHQHHGHEVRYQGGIGGIGIPLLKAVSDWDRVKPCHLHCIGHWHQQRDFESAIVNGSLIGFNAYAMKIRAPYAPPLQTFFLLDPKRGKSSVDPIWVWDSSESEAA